MPDPIASVQVQVAVRRRYRPGFTWSSTSPPLDWDGCLLWHLVHGEAVWTVGGQATAMSGGMLALHPLDGPSVRVRCGKTGSHTVQWAYLPGPLRLDLPRFIALPDPAHAERLLQQAIDARPHPSDEADAAVRALLFQIRRLHRQPSGRRRDLDEFDLVCERMRKALADDWSVERIARDLRLGERAVFDLFQRHRGTTPHDHVLHLRIAEAQRLLRSTGMPLKAIAASVGFCDQYALSNRFLAVVGERPSAWRRPR